MKHKILTITISLLFVGLLVSLSPVSGQKHKSRKPETTKVQPSQPSSTPTPRLPTLEGTYILDDPSSTERIKAAIEAAVKGMVWPFKGQARGKLQKKNLPPPPQLVISYTKPNVTITTYLGAIQTPANSTFVDRVVQGEKLSVSTNWTDERLERIYKGREGQRVSTYRLSTDGKALTLQVTLTSGWTQPCAYELKYRRTR